MPTTTRSNWVAPFDGHLETSLRGKINKMGVYKNNNPRIYTDVANKEFTQRGT